MPSPNSNRLTEIRVKGMRTLADVRLPLDGLTVLIGENGAGKSTLVEAFEILRKIGEDRAEIVEAINRGHGGLAALLRLGSSRFGLGVTLVAGDERYEYDFALGSSQGYTVVEEERLAFARGGELAEVFRRAGQAAWVGDQPATGLLQGGTLALFALQGFNIDPFRTALKAIDVRLPFETRPLWLTQERQWTAPLRVAVPTENAPSLARLGDNLAAAYYTLREHRSREEWEETKRLVKLGLGPGVEDVKFPAPFRGSVELMLEISGVGQVPAATLSDGQLTYLALIAMARLSGQRSALVFDEPDLHLHPELLMRVLDVFEGMSERHPVVLTTHSDRLLDGLTEPAKSVVLCALGPQRTTEFLRPDPVALVEWRKSYRGLGSIQADGMASYVMTRKVGE